MPDAKLYCGTSGFAYRSWRPNFYPQSLAATERLAYYATRLSAVELNGHNWLMNKRRLERWATTVPSGFLFLPRMRMEFEREEFTKNFLQTLEPLQASGHLGPVLFQIGSRQKAHSGKLARFLQQWPQDRRVAFEFRSLTWFDERIYQVLRDANAALCLAEGEDLETPWVLTSDFVYLRLRKPEYLESKLISVQYRAEQYLANAYPTFAIFKGGKSAAGALNAEKLLVSQRAVGTP
jgi:uncharacterized protein YecE (DUF72 family)